MELINRLSMLHFAGHETTANLLVMLLREPERLEALSLDARRIPAAIKEALRFDAPVQGMMRAT